MLWSKNIYTHYNPVVSFLVTYFQCSRKFTYMCLVFLMWNQIEKIHSSLVMKKMNIFLIKKIVGVKLFVKKTLYIYINIYIYIYIYIYIWKKIIDRNPTVCEEKLTSSK